MIQWRVTLTVAAMALMCLNTCVWVKLQDAELVCDMSSDVWNSILLDITEEHYDRVNESCPRALSKRDHNERKKDHCLASEKSSGPLGACKNMRSASKTM